jgi:hypothetical protein
MYHLFWDEKGRIEEFFMYIFVEERMGTVQWPRWSGKQTRKTNTTNKWSVKYLAACSVVKVDLVVSYILLDLTERYMVVLLFLSWRRRWQVCFCAY